MVILPTVQSSVLNYKSDSSDVLVVDSSIFHVPVSVTDLVLPSSCIMMFQLDLYRRGFVVAFI